MKMIKYVIYSCIAILIFANCCRSKVEDINKYKGCIIMDQQCRFSKLNGDAYLVIKDQQDSIFTVYIDNSHCNIFKNGDTIK